MYAGFFYPPIQSKLDLILKRVRIVKKMFIGNLPSDASEDTVNTLFSEFGKVRSIRLVSDVFTGKCKGFGFIEMEGHEARAAIEGLNGKTIGGKLLQVRYDDPRASEKRKHKR